MVLIGRKVWYSMPGQFGRLSSAKVEIDNNVQGNLNRDQELLLSTSYGQAQVLGSFIRG